MAESNVPVERWLPIPDWEGSYEASSLGRVRSLDRLLRQRSGILRRHRGRVLSQSPSGSGYLKVALGRGNTKYVHQLVLMAFVGRRPLGMEACHANGHLTDNRASNLTWDTSTMNKLDRIRHGTDPHSRRTVCPLGHSLIAPNLVAREVRRGYRACLACNRAQSSGWLARRRGRAFDLRADADERYKKIMTMEAI